MDDFLFNKIFNPTHISSLEGEELKSSKLIQDEFTDIVDMLRKDKHIKLSPINDLMALFWDLVGNKVCPAAMANVPTLSFWCEIHNNKSAAFVIMPENWHDMLVENPHYQMGAMVFAASHAKDYWNEKYVQGEKGVLQRAYSFESELLHYFKANVEGFKPNEYQTKIMAKFPLGIKSCDSHYLGKEYK